MTVSLRKLADAFNTLLKNPLLINAYIYTADGKIQSINWGDDINFHFIKHLTKRDVAIYFDTPVAMALRRTNYLCIGSTLNYLSTRQTVVWGAGIIDDQLDLREEPARILAVRGPLTQQFLLSRGVSCPEVYGDPALLLPYFYKPIRLEKSRYRRIGIVRHYADKDSSILNAIKCNHPDVEFIDVANYAKWTDFIDQICGCEAVFSSSLHGLIVAESYGIPNFWISVSDKVIGNGFKFRDFYASIGKSIEAPIILDHCSNLTKLVTSFSWSQGRLELKKLIAACPFEIKEPVLYEHPMDL